MGVFWPVLWYSSGDYLSWQDLKIVEKMVFLTLSEGSKIASLHSLITTDVNSLQRKEEDHR